MIISAPIFALLLLIFFFTSIKIVPQKRCYIVERLGKYNRALTAGLSFIIPFVDRVAYKHSLKETVIDVPLQVCITKDNIAVEVDGILYLQVVDAQKASYGINDYLLGTIQIAQTTIRSIIGKLALDQTFAEREHINSRILEVADKASDPWGVKVTRYEIKDIKPPQSIKDAMEKQMRAEREKRATIAVSEGEQQSTINRAEAERAQKVAQAKAKVYEILETAKATAEGIECIAKAIQNEKGEDAVTLRIAEQYLKEFGNLAKTNNTMIIPSNLTDLSSIIATATAVFKNSEKGSLISSLTKSAKSESKS